MNTDVDQPYNGTGNLGQAIKDLQRAAFGGVTDRLPRYWREFAEQLAADVLALQFELSVLKKPKRQRGRKKATKRP